MRNPKIVVPAVPIYTLSAGLTLIRILRVTDPLVRQKFRMLRLNFLKQLASEIGHYTEKIYTFRVEFPGKFQGFLHRLLCILRQSEHKIRHNVYTDLVSHFNDRFHDCLIKLTFGNIRHGKFIGRLDTLSKPFNFCLFASLQNRPVYRIDPGICPSIDVVIPAYQFIACCVTKLQVHYKCFIQYFFNIMHAIFLY